MRLRFLTASGDGGDATAKKGAVDFTDDLVTSGEEFDAKQHEEFVAARKKFEDESICYISLDG
eukprot:TRINITY_DN9020_c0_g1_i1.p1 TRINITY_DN9020_c0_g1~~TRINITY_DN9020_c0_g1_i1.p1  ORF type:complete len:63 (+),score=25.95 TRINITY_DN9020_c0_g1_i1:127-315(+)